jgi:hypothetical protein
MNSYEKNGFYNFIYITLFNYFESFLTKYLDTHLTFIKYDLNNKTAEKRLINTNGVDNYFDQNKDRLINKRIIEEKSKILNSASYGKLKEHHKIILDKSIRDFIGEKLYTDLEGASAFRNLLVHGKDINIDSIDGLTSPKLFQKHELEKTVKSLKSNNIISENDINFREMLEKLYADETIFLYWNTIIELEKIYMDTIDDQYKMHFKHVGLLKPLE